MRRTPGVMGSLSVVLSLYLARISNDPIAAATDSPLGVSPVAVFRSNEEAEA